MENNTFPVMEIDIDSVTDNYCLLSQHIGKSTELSCVVKSDAYGLGIARIVPALHEAGASSFYVSYLEEGLVTAYLAPGKDIYVLYPESQKGIYTCIEHGLIPVLNSEKDIDAVLSHHSTMKSVVVHIDTGMNRCGISPLQASSLREKLSRLAERSCLLLISHYSDAESGKSTHCFRQESALKSCAFYIRGHVRLGIANTGGILLPQPAMMEQVRIGAALYGFNHNPSGRICLPENIKSAAKVYTTVLDIRKVEKGSGFGYGRSFTAEKETVIAIIKMGYSHGFPRQYSTEGSKYRILIDGFPTSVVGSVAMETMAVDISNLPANSIRIGDIATVIANSKHAEELAFSSGTLIADIYSRLGSGCIRHYKESKKKRSSRPYRKSERNVREKQR